MASVTGKVHLKGGMGCTLVSSPKTGHVNGHTSHTSQKQVKTSIQIQLQQSVASKFLACFFQVGPVTKKGSEQNIHKMQAKLNILPPGPSFPVEWSQSTIHWILINVGKTNYMYAVQTTGKMIYLVSGG